MLTLKNRFNKNKNIMHRFSVFNKIFCSKCIHIKMNILYMQMKVKQNMLLAYIMLISQIIIQIKNFIINLKILTVLTPRLYHSFKLEYSWAFPGTR